MTACNSLLEEGNCCAESVCMAEVAVMSVIDEVDLLP